ncbi:MAG: DapH/DapD/GlmU-related protein [Hyphomicrobiales bacterium]
MRDFVVMPLIILRKILWHAGFYRWRFRRLFGLQECQLGDVWFSIEHPEHVSIRSKTIGQDHPAAEPVGIQQKGDGHIDLGEDTIIRRGVRLNVRGTGSIRLGRGSVLGKRTVIETYGAADITIGAGCRVGWDCLFLPSDQHLVLKDGKELPFEDDIVIGDHVWFGTRVVVLKGTRIGSNCVVAAGAICHGEFPENCLIAGAPAKVIKKDVNWRDLKKHEIAGVPRGSTE